MDIMNISIWGVLSEQRYMSLLSLLPGAFIQRVIKINIVSTHISNNTHTHRHTLNLESCVCVLSKRNTFGIPKTDRGLEGVLVMSSGAGEGGGVSSVCVCVYVSVCGGMCRSIIILLPFTWASSFPPVTERVQFGYGSSSHRAKQY